MSEFTKVLDRIHENLENGQPMFDGIDYLAGTQWVPALALNDTPELYRVKPVVTGMFSADIVKEFYTKHYCGLSQSSVTALHHEFADSLNEFVESKLGGIREQAIRDFIECNVNVSLDDEEYNDWVRRIDIYASKKLGSDCGKYKNAFNQGITAATELSVPSIPHLMFQPGTPVPSDFPSAPAMPASINKARESMEIPIIEGMEQRITIQPGDYVPHELITSEAVFDLVVKAFTAAFPDIKNIECYEGYSNCSIESQKGFGVTTDSEEIVGVYMSALRPLTLQQLFNASNGLEWPEGTDILIDSLGCIEFSESKSPQAPVHKVIATRVK